MYMYRIFRRSGQPAPHNNDNATYIQFSQSYILHTYVELVFAILHTKYFIMTILHTICSNDNTTYGQFSQFQIAKLQIEHQGRCVQVRGRPPRRPCGALTFTIHVYIYIYIYIHTYMYNTSSKCTYT